jgi:hypothetical protein
MGVPTSPVLKSKNSKNANYVAHGLAKFSREIMCEDVLDALVPPCVEDLAQKDCASGYKNFFVSSVIYTPKKNYEVHALRLFVLDD